MEQIAQALFPFSHWSWWIVSALLVILEVVAPGVLFLWLGVSAAIVGVVVFALPDLDWKLQFALFAALSVITVALSRRYLRRHPQATDHPTLNRRAEAQVGRTFQLAEPIRDGRGVADMDGTRWQISGPDCPAGTRVRVTGADGTMLRVDRADDQSRP